MITQRPISLKIGYSLLDELDKEVALGWLKRNTLINEAIRLYLDFADLRRSNPSDEDIKRFVAQRLPYIGKSKGIYFST